MSKEPGTKEDIDSQTKETSETNELLNNKIKENNQVSILNEIISTDDGNTRQIVVLNESENKSENINDNDSMCKSTTTSNSNELVCRICHCEDANERLIIPCKCKGSIKVVHESCLVKWMNYNRKHFDKLYAFLN